MTDRQILLELYARARTGETMDSETMEDFLGEHLNGPCTEPLIIKNNEWICGCCKTRGEPDDTPDADGGFKHVRLRFSATCPAEVLQADTETEFRMCRECGAVFEIEEHERRVWFIGTQGADDLLEELERRIEALYL